MKNFLFFSIISCMLSLTQSVNAYIGYPVSLMSSVITPGPITGPAAVCPHQSGVTYSVAANPAAVFAWTVPAGASVTSGQGTNTITVEFGTAYGDICVTADDGTGPGLPSCMSTFQALTKPGVPTISGPSTAVCPGHIVNFSVSPDPLAATYNWVIPPRMTVLSGLGTESIMVQIDSGFVWGYLRVSASNCKGTSAQYVHGVYSAPPKPGSVTGPQVGACPGGTYTYSFAPVPGATSYTWYAPAGCIVTSPVASGNPLTTSVTTVDITFPAGFTYGELLITSNSGCNSSEPRKMKIRSVPMKPGGISGPFYGVCGMNSVMYTIDSVAGATSYTWNFTPSTFTVIHDNGNDTVTVDFLPGYTHATLCLTANNNCGSSIARCGVVFSRPETSDTIQGPVGACNTNPANSIAYYKIDTIFGASNYTWNVPAGAVITAGQGTPEITVDFLGASTGDVTVQGSNNCGVTSVKTHHVIINACRTAGHGFDAGSEAMSVYPNPARGQVSVDLDMDGGAEYTLLISDLTGRIVKQVAGTSVSGINKTIIDLNDMHPGIYLVRAAWTGREEIIKLLVE